MGLPEQFFEKISVAIIFQQGGRSPGRGVSLLGAGNLSGYLQPQSRLPGQSLALGDTSTLYCADCGIG